MADDPAAHDALSGPPNQEAESSSFMDRRRRYGRKETIYAAVCYEGWRGKIPGFMAGEY
jgi:hypothetical protein